MNSEIQKHFREAERKNKNLFGIKPPKYNLIICNSISEYKKKTGYTYYQGGGTVKRNNIFILSKRDKNMLSTKDVLYHELNHLFYKSIAGHYKPQWLSEGIALFNQKSYRVDGKNWKRHFKALKNKENRLLVKTYKNMPLQKRNEFYVLSYFCTKWLTKKHGTKKVINFLKEIPNPYNNEVFWKAFEKKFKINKKDLVEKALQT